MLKVKKRAKTMVGGFIVSFTLNVFINFIKPLVLSVPLLPRVSSVAYSFLLLSVWYSMFRFDFLGNTLSVIERNPLWKKPSSRERMIVPLLYDGLTYKEAAFRLSISEGTLRKHMENIYRKTEKTIVFCPGVRLENPRARELSFGHLFEPGLRRPSGPHTISSCAASGSDLLLVQRESVERLIDRFPLIAQCDTD